MKIYEIDSENLGIDVVRGKTIVKMVLLQDVKSLIDKLEGHTDWRTLQDIKTTIKGKKRLKWQDVKNVELSSEQERYQ